MSSRKRKDMWSKLTHWTRGDSEREALERLIKICSDEMLVSAAGVGTYDGPCVCFTEAPPWIFHTRDSGFVSKFGVCITKEWAFENGARPAIYQPDDEKHLLDESIRWRHVTLDFRKGRPRNFTWMREWRIKCEHHMQLPPDAMVIVPDDYWKGELLKAINDINHCRGLWAVTLGGYYFRSVLNTSEVNVLTIDDCERIFS